MRGGPLGAGLIRRQAVDAVHRERARELRHDQTPAEALLWAELPTIRSTDPVFRRQQVVRSFISDFYCHAAGLIIELDGLVHDAGAHHGHDALRDDFLRSRGLRILRIPNEDVLLDVQAVVRQVVEVARSSRTSPPAPSPTGEGRRGTSRSCLLAEEFGDDGAPMCPPLPTGEGQG